MPGRALNSWNVLWAYESHIRRWRAEGLTLEQIRAKLDEQHVRCSVGSIRAVLKGRMK